MNTLRTPAVGDFHRFRDRLGSYWEGLRTYGDNPSE